MLSGIPGKRNSPLGSPKRISTSDLFGLQSGAGRQNDNPYKNMKVGGLIHFHDCNDFIKEFALKISAN